LRCAKLGKIVPFQMTAAPFRILILAVLAYVTMTSSAAASVLPPFGIAHWWDGDDNTSDRIGDVDGMPQNDPGFAPGMVGQAFSFDGIDDTVSFGNAVGNFGIKDFTIEFWVKTSSTRFEGVIGKRPDCGYGSFFDFRIGVTGFLELSEDISTANYNRLSTSIALNDGVFHHVAITRQGNVASIFVDGILDVAGATAAVTDIHNDADIVIGRSACVAGDGTDFFTGVLDEISLYDRALSASEISAIFSATGEGKLKVKYVVIDVAQKSDIVVGKRSGRIKVAINGSATFDTKSIQSKTVRFGVSGAEAAPASSRRYDLNKDGYPDRVFIFRTIKTGIQCGDISAFLTGLTTTGQWFFGSDEIKTAACK
jgi:hypothetical protein